MRKRNPPAVWSIVLTALTVLWVLEDSSRQVAPAPSVTCLPPIVAIVLVGNYIYHVVRTSPAVSGSARTAWRWLVLPVAAIAVFSALATYWPMKLRFALSRAAFEHTVKQMQAGDGADLGPQRIGLYWVKRVKRMEQDKVGFEVGASIIDPVAITYNPANPKSHPFNMRITEDWYAEEW